jgi:hypothetical protein
MFYLITTRGEKDLGKWRTAQSKHYSRAMDKAILVSQATCGYLTYNLTNNNIYFK